MDFQALHVNQCCSRCIEGSNFLYHSFLSPPLVWIEARSYLLTAPNGHQLGSLLATTALYFGTPRSIRTARRWIQEVGRLPGNRCKPCATFLIKTWNGPEQPHCVGMSRCLENLLDRGRFYNMPCIHHVHMLAGSCNYTKIMSNQHHGSAKLF